MTFSVCRLQASSFRAKLGLMGTHSVDPISVVLAADDGYALPLTVAARSVIDSLDPRSELCVYVLDMGIEAQNRQEVERSLRGDKSEVVWIDSLQSQVRDLPNTWHAITRAGYARIFIPTVVPDDVHRAIYLDCDVIAIRSVHELASSEMNGAAAMGVPDLQSPFVCSPAAVPRWFEAGRSASELNFNSGVMLMDLDAWRERDLTSKLLTYLTDGSHYFGQDQEAINATLAGQIGELDPRWNQQSELFQLEYEVTLPYSREELADLKADPWIIHYSNLGKPWQFGCQHPMLDRWFASLDRTTFAGWRPKRSRRDYLAIGERQARSAARRLKII